jgi:leader peptidase (prepilin peptidase) / N-methyltransferase
VTIPASGTWLIIAALLAGSFFGVIVTRAEAAGSILWDRSRCETCRHTLGARDLVPFLSWLASRGRCRYCGARIGLFYPLFELATVVVTVWALTVEAGGLLWATAVFGWLLLTLAALDARLFILPDFLTLPLVVIGLAVDAALGTSALVAGLIGTAAGYLFILLVRAAYARLRGREGIGMGDAKLLAAAGAWVGWQGLPSVVLIAAIVGLVIVLLLRMRGSSLSLTDRVPFGTFLCLGMWLVWLYGPIA